MNSKPNENLSQQSQSSPSHIIVAGTRIEVFRKGSGRPILFLHPEAGIDVKAPVIDLLAKKGEVIVPSHPGFGNSDLPTWMSNVDDLAYFYLDFMQELDLHDVTLVGISFGAWIAAEIAIKSTARLSRTILADAVGIKVGGREDRDIADIFALTEQRFAELAFHDPAMAKRDIASLSDDDLRSIARNRESSAMFGWTPYMHNPKLKWHLHRIDVPTLFLWGESDGIVTPDYGRAFCAAVPGARFELIAKAGHSPHLEQPATFAQQVLAFIDNADSHQPGGLS